MLEEIRYAYSRYDASFTGVIVEPNPQDGVYVGPIVGRVGLDGIFYGMRDSWIAQVLGPGRIALHYSNALPVGDDFAIYQKKRRCSRRPPTKMGTGHAGRIQRRQGYLVPQYGKTRRQLETGRALDYADEESIRAKSSRVFFAPQ